MEVICEACGVANRPGTEFCLFCGAYLAWDRSVLIPPRGPAQPPAARPPASPASGPASDPYTPAPPATPPALVGQPTPLDPSRPGVAAPAPPLPPAPPEGPRQDQAPARTAVWPTTAAGPSIAAGGSCPSCGRVNDPSLRFCAKCGQVLSNPVASQPSGVRRGESAWSRVSASRDRAARRAYRRSLPPLYRWRRVLIGILVVALGLGGMRAVGRHPVRWAVEHYYDLRKTTVIVGGVQASVDPPDASVPNSNPAALTDLSVAAWTMTWTPAEQGTTCGGAPGTGVIALTLPPTRIRQINLQAGLLATDANRPLEFRPQSLGVSFDGGPCHNLPLADKPDWQDLTVDSGVQVRTVRIGVDTAYAARADGGQPRLSITEIVLRARPTP